MLKNSAIKLASSKLAGASLLSGSLFLIGGIVETGSGHILLRVQDAYSSFINNLWIF